MHYIRVGMTNLLRFIIMDLWTLGAERQMNHSHHAAARLVWLVLFLAQTQRLHPGSSLPQHMLLKKLHQDEVVVEECVWAGARTFLVVSE